MNPSVNTGFLAQILGVRFSHPLLFPVIVMITGFFVLSSNHAGFEGSCILESV
nr:MAG TPA: hypothetical protein [Caudoviricetes sp.]